MKALLANVAYTGTSVAVRRLDLQQNAKLRLVRLRSSGKDVHDLVPAYTELSRPSNGFSGM